MNACKQQEEKTLSRLISRTFKYYFSTFQHHGVLMDPALTLSERGLKLRAYQGLEIHHFPLWTHASDKIQNTATELCFQVKNAAVYCSTENRWVFSLLPLGKYILSVCGRVFQSLDAEFEMAWSQTVSSCTLHPHLECENMTLKNSGVLLAHDWEWMSCWRHQGAVFKTTACHTQHFVVNTLFHRQPVKSSQDRLDAGCPFCARHNSCCNVLDKLKVV